MKLFLIPLILSLRILANGYHYNDYPYNDNRKEAPRYPDYCCPLEWVNITNGQELPKDWIYAGTFMDRNFAFTRTGHPGLGIGVKSSRKEEPPYGFSETFSNSFPILTNPNKCFIDWYIKEAYEGIPKSNDEIFFPSNGRSKNGIYAQYDGIPGWMAEDGGFYRMESVSTHERVERRERNTVAELKLMYVDCKKSFQSMYDYQLINLSFDQNTFDKLKSSNKRVQHIRKAYLNDSPQDSTANFKFSVTTQDNLNMKHESTLNGVSYLKSDIYSNWIDSVQINQLLSDVRFESGRLDHAKIWKIPRGGAVFDKGEKINVHIFGAHHEEKFNFDQEIVISSSSKVVVTAFSNPVIGKVPFNATYELSSKKAGDNLITIDMIKDNIKRYTEGELVRFEETKLGTLQVTYEGIMDIDSGNEVHLEIKSSLLYG